MLQSFRVYAICKLHALFSILTITEIVFFYLLPIPTKTTSRAHFSFDPVQNGCRVRMRAGSKGCVPSVPIAPCRTGARVRMFPIRVAHAVAHDHQTPFSKGRRWMRRWTRHVHVQSTSLPPSHNVPLCRGVPVSSSDCQQARVAVPLALSFSLTLRYCGLHLGLFALAHSTTKQEQLLSRPRKWTPKRRLCYAQQLPVPMWSPFRSRRVVFAPFRSLTARVRLQARCSRPQHTHTHTSHHRAPCTLNAPRRTVNRAKLPKRTRREAAQE